MSASEQTAASLARRVAALEKRAQAMATEVEALAERVEQGTRVEAIIRRASYPESMLYGRERPHRKRPGHLHAVKEGKS